jgi:hypothetical protein
MSDPIVTPPVGAPAPAAAPASQPKSPAPKAPAEPGSPEWDAEYKAEMAKLKKPAVTPAPKTPAEGDAGDDLEGEGGELGELEEGLEAGEEGGTEEQREQRLKKFKVNGKEVEIDLADEAAVERHIQRGLAADERFEHASTIEKRAEALGQRAQTFINNLLSDPFKVLEQPQFANRIPDLRKRAEMFLYNKMVEDKLSPEERAARKKEATDKEELENYRNQRQESEQKAQAEEREANKELARQRHAKGITKALDDSGLPKTDWTVQRTAHYMRVALRKGYKNIQAGDVVHLVKADWDSHFRQFMSNVPDDKILDVLGGDADRARKARLAKAKRGGGGGAAPAPRATPQPRPEPGPAYSSAEELRDASVARARGRR